MKVYYDDTFVYQPMYMAKQNEIHCLLETSFGYTGVNIKIPLEKDIRTMRVIKMTYVSGDWKYKQTTYNEYLDNLPEKERNRKLKEDRYNTFLVFHSGKVIMSGLIAEFMSDKYTDFLKIINRAYPYIEERLED